MAFAKNKDIKIEKTLALICYAIGLCGLATMVYFCFSSSIWTDEAFTLALIDHSYLESVVLTANDVHPPLYYLLLKVFVQVVSLIVPGLDVVVIGKLFSATVFVVIYLMALIPVRKEFGSLVSGLFAALMMTFPPIMEYGVEIRMYQLAILFVSLAYIELHSAIKYGVRKKNWTAFAIFSICAAYTQLFACLAIGMLYLCALVWIVLFSGQRKKTLWKPFFRCIISMVICFFPWLVVVIRQFMMLQEDYWIDPITKYDIPIYWNFLFPYIYLGIFVVAVVLAAIIFCIIKKISFDSLYYGLIGLAVVFLVICAGVAVSKILKPIFAIRYVVPAMGAMWLGIVILAVAVSKHPVLKAAVTGVILTASVMGIMGFYNSETELKTYSDEVLEFLDAHKDAGFISGKDYLEEDLQSYSGEPGYLYKEIPIDVMQQVYGDNLILIDTDDVAGVINKYDEVYYVEGGEGYSAEEFAKDTGLEPIEVARFIMEGNAVFYRIK